MNLIFDGHQSQTSIKLKILCDQLGTILKILEKGTPWANIAELYIGILKEEFRKDMRASHSPMLLWDYVIEHYSLIHSTIPRPLFHNTGLTPHEVTLGAPADISNTYVYVWYEWTLYCNHRAFPENRYKLGIVIVPIKMKVIKYLRPYLQ